MGMIPKKTKAETKVFKGLTAQRFLGLLMVLMVAAMIGSFIGGVLQWVFVVFAVIVFFILTGRSPTNPSKTFFRGLLDFISFKFDVKKMIGTSHVEYVTYEMKEEEKAESKQRKEDKK